MLGCLRAKGFEVWITGTSFSSLRILFLTKATLIATIAFWGLYANGGIRRLRLEMKDIETEYEKIPG
jgi:hypothetical protein